MTVKATAYRLCKAVIASKLREELQALIHDLNVSSDASGRPGRGQFGYAARRQGANLLGYLIVDQERARIASGPLPMLIPPLADQERQLLANVHAELLALNHACIETIISARPALQNALNPYSEVIPLTAVGTVQADSRMISEVLVQEMVGEFAKHAAIGTLTSTPAAVVGNLDERAIYPTVISLLQLIAQAGPGHVPTAVRNAAIAMSPSDPNRLMFYYFGAIVVLRDSLRNLNQMLYQAILADKPPILDEESVIRIEDIRSGFLGTSATLSFQPEPDTIVLEPGDLALLKQLPKSSIPLEGLLRLETLRFQHSVDFGSTYTIQTRFLDDNLSSYGPLGDPT